jgi:hypothetical protein
MDIEPKYWLQILMRQPPADETPHCQRFSPE